RPVRRQRLTRQCCRQDAIEQRAQYGFHGRTLKVPCNFSILLIFGIEFAVCRPSFHSPWCQSQFGFLLVALQRRDILGTTVKKLISACYLRATGSRCAICFFGCWLLLVNASVAAPPKTARTTPPMSAFVSSYCVRCHDEQLKKGGLDLEAIGREDVTQHSTEWEKVVRKLRAR